VPYDVSQQQPEWVKVMNSTRGGRGVQMSLALLSGSGCPLFCTWRKSQYHLHHRKSAAFMGLTLPFYQRGREQKMVQQGLWDAATFPTFLAQAWTITEGALRNQAWWAWLLGFQCSVPLLGRYSVNLSNCKPMYRLRNFCPNSVS